MSKAARYIHVDPDILLSIYKTEGGTAGAISMNTNKTYDMGPMQINSIWIRKFNPRLGLTKKALIHNGCKNVLASAIILRHEINLAKGNLWKGVGNYHSKTPRFHNRYLAKVKKHYRKIKVKSKRTRATQVALN